jgi:hypothetical protein
MECWCWNQLKILLPNVFDILKTQVELDDGLNDDLDFIFDINFDHLLLIHFNSFLDNFLFHMTHMHAF